MGGRVILNGGAILQAVVSGEIEIDPFSEDQLNSDSYDLRLGVEVLTYDFSELPYDVREEPRTKHEIISPYGYVIRPGVGYLMSTRERVKTNTFVPVLDGKSSVARLFVSIHQCAGFGDRGFDGQFTLEVTTIYPIRLYAGMRIGQMRFHVSSGPDTKLYDGNYKGDGARGPVASRTWKQIARDEKRKTEEVCGVCARPYLTCDCMGAGGR